VVMADRVPRSFCRVVFVIPSFLLQLFMSLSQRNVFCGSSYSRVPSTSSSSSSSYWNTLCVDYNTGWWECALLFVVLVSVPVVFWRFGGCLVVVFVVVVVVAVGP
jgi:hypothetical protein